MRQFCFFGLLVGESVGGWVGGWAGVRAVGPRCAVQERDWEVASGTCCPRPLSPWWSVFPQRLLRPLFAIHLLSCSLALLLSYSLPPRPRSRRLYPLPTLSLPLPLPLTRFSPLLPFHFFLFFFAPSSFIKVDSRAQPSTVRGRHQTPLKENRSNVGLCGWCGGV